MKSAIQLISHQFTRIELYTTDAIAPDGEMTGSHTLSIRQSDNDDDVWLARLELGFNNADSENPAPYTGSLHVVGKFNLHPDFPKESSEKMVAMNTGAILYGAARELIISLTARSLHGILQVPTIDARSFCQEEEPKKNTE